MRLPRIPRHGQRRIHFVLMAVWILVGIPYSIYKRESVPWVVFLSVYAIIATHWVGWTESERDDGEKGP